jgi:septum formation protein
MHPLILASASPRRAQLLAEIGVPFTVVPAEVEEDEGLTLGPREMVLHNARLKGLAVAGRFPERVVLAADTTVFIDDKILNKPRDLDEAWAMLRRLSGRTHTVFTAFFVKGPAAPFECEEGVESRVTFKKLDDVTIGNYFQKVNPLDKAGAYGIQEGSEQIIAGYEGSLTNIIGLPMEETKRALQRFGFPGN